MDLWLEVSLFITALYVIYKMVMTFLRKQTISSLHDKHVFITGTDTGRNKMVSFSVSFSKVGGKVLFDIDQTRFFALAVSVF